MRLAAMLVCFVAAPLVGQRDAVDRLGSNDPLERERARRELACVERDALPIDRLRRLRASGDEAQRIVATRLLTRFGVDIELDPSEPSVRVRAVSAAGWSTEQCADVLSSEPHDGVAREALRELAERGALAPEHFAAALLRGDDRAAAMAAKLLVQRVAPFPLDLLERIEEHDAACRVLLRELALHPRVAAVPWLRRLLARRTEPSSRLAVFVAFPRGELDARDGREIIAAAEHVRISLVREAADRLSPRDADRLVGALHQRAVEGLELDVALEMLNQATADGERHLLALARVASPQHLDTIVDWLARRESNAIDGLVRDALRDESDVEPFLLRRAGRVVDDPEIRRRVVGLLRSADAETAVAAFEALVRGGVYTEPMLDYALAGSEVEDVERRVRTFLTLPDGQLDDRAWRRLLATEITRVQVGALQRLYRQDALRPEYEPMLAELAQQPDYAGTVAARVLAAKGRRAAVQQLFATLDPVRRRETVTSLSDRDESWVLPLLLADSERESAEFRATRVALGDRGEIDAVFADPTRWTVAWLRRRDAEFTAGLRADHLGALEAALVGSSKVSARIRLELVGWIAKRPDLPFGPLLERVYREDDDIGISELALEGLLRHDAGDPIRARVDTAVGGPMDEETEDLAYTVVAALERPLDDESARLVARMLLVAPLGDPRREIEAHFGLERGAAAPGVVLTNIAMQQLRGGPTASTVRAIEAASDEAASHPNRHALGRARLGRILTDLWREPAARLPLAPAVARLIIESPDLEPEYLGPAWLARAERAESEGAFERAAQDYERAITAFAYASPFPPVARVFVDHHDPGSGRIPSAALGARPDLCRAQVAMRDGNPVRARRLLERAAALAHGDESTESEIRSFLDEVAK